MKLYINNFNLNILKDIQKSLEDKLVLCENFIEIFTDEGIYCVEKNNIYILEPIDGEIKIFNYFGDVNNFTLISDSSYFKKTIVPSVYGNHNVSLNIKKYIYKLNKNSKLQLIILFIETNNDKFIPSDIYFKINENTNINELSIKEEINEFLSLLN
jgi:hypothetical protein